MDATREVDETKAMPSSDISQSAIQGCRIAAKIL
jgi:hypothetical protein